ncbi:hypothetical protein [Xanthobacter autotrophicus]|uniref:hypothetical protein n=1 Tax=Xanthobacter autotrophicus TaxID=280 RepID=UPI003729C4F6
MAENHRDPLPILTFRDLVQVQIELEAARENATSGAYAKALGETLVRVETMLEAMQARIPGRTQISHIGIVETPEGC